jgi:flagellar biosynthesis/type III secretory pathway M-ring protein FliF/YscJ
MSIQWKPILGSVAALMIVKLTDHFFGMAASIITLSAILLAWFGIHYFYKNLLKKMKAMLAEMSDEEKENFLSQATPAIRKDLQKQKELHGPTNRKEGEKGTGSRNDRG